MVCLQETHGVEKNCKSRITQLGFQKGIFSLHTNASRGAAVLWRDSVKQIGEAWTQPDGRIAAVVLQKEAGIKSLVVSVYAPNLAPSSSSQSNYVSFLITLEFVLSEMKRKVSFDNIFLMGDFNLIWDPEVDSLSASPKTYNIPLDALQEVLRKFELIDAFRALHPVEKAFTFSRRGHLLKGGDRAPPIMNRLDYAFVKADTVEKVKLCEHRDMALTDHKMVLLDSSPEVPGRKKLLGLWKHNDQLNRDTLFVQMMSKNLKEFVPKAQEECQTERGAWEAIKGKIREWSRRYSIDKMKERGQIKSVFGTKCKILQAIPLEQREKPTLNQKQNTTKSVKEKCNV